jgi:hypothetical protein
MKNLSTGFGLALLAGAILAYPFVSSLAPNANASAVTAAASAVSTTATGQTGPTIVWYGVTNATVGSNGTANGSLSYPYLFRAWSDGKIEATRGYIYDGFGICQWSNSACTGTQWVVVSDPAQGLTYRSDINFDEKVDGADLGALLADWGNAPRQDIPPSDCPLNLVNPS